MVFCSRAPSDRMVCCCHLCAVYQTFVSSHFLTVSNPVTRIRLPARYLGAVPRGNQSAASGQTAHASHYSTDTAQQSHCLTVWQQSTSVTGRKKQSTSVTDKQQCYMSACISLHVLLLTTCEVSLKIQISPS